MIFPTYSGIPAYTWVCHPIAFRQTGSRATLVLFDFKEKQIKIGWSSLRVIQAETKMDSIQLQVDKLFLDTVGGIELLHHYASEEEGEKTPDVADTGANQEEDLAANGMLVPWQTDVEMELADMMLEEYPDFFQPEDDPDADDVFCLGLVLPEENDKNEMEIEVTIDESESGNLIAACPEIELVSEMDAHPEEGEVSMGFPDGHT